MKRKSRQLEALTLIEVLAIIVILFVLSALLFPVRTHSGPSRRMMCTSNLKQVGLGFVMWADDHNEYYPWQIPVSNSGTLEFIYTGHTFPHFEKLSRYLREPRVFRCPADTSRHAATNYAALSDQSVSFFLNVDLARTNPAGWIVAGDRNLLANGQPVKPGLFTLTTNLGMNWTHELHTVGGSLAFADGHTEFIRTNRLNKIVRSRNSATNRLVIP